MHRRESRGRLGWLTARPIAHRGLHDKNRGIIENTPGAFAAAIAAGYPIECDLQVSRDGEAMVFHDSSLERLTMATGRVDAMTAGELGKVELRATTDRMQCLGELLEQVDGRVGLVIELKSHFDASDVLVRRTLDVLADYDGDAAIMSFDPDMIEAARKYAPWYFRGIVTDRSTTAQWPRLSVGRRLEMRHLAHLTRTRPDFLSYQADALPVHASRAFRDFGKPVICWTVRSPREAHRAYRYADQITFEGFRP